MEMVDHEDSIIRSFGTNKAALEFWDNPNEDIYGDYLIGLGCF